jgi:hypothetical protein
VKAQNPAKLGLFYARVVSRATPYYPPRAPAAPLCAPLFAPPCQRLFQRRIPSSADVSAAALALPFVPQLDEEAAAILDAPDTFQSD